MYRKQTSLLFIVNLFFIGQIMAQADFESFLKTALKAPFYERAHLAVSVRDVQTGQILASFQDKKWMVPASSLKVLTTIVAYDILGADFRFETSLYTDGHIDKNGVLHGNVIVKGGGDPTLGSDRISGNPTLDKTLQSMVEAVKNQGIREIKGYIITDESIFADDPLAPSWQWNDIGNYYAGGAWGINIVENEYKIFFQRDKMIGSKADILYIEPNVPDLFLNGHVMVDKAGTGDNAYIFEGPKHYSKTLRGTIPFGKSLFPVKGALPDPPRFLAYRLMEALKKAGIASSDIRTTKEAFPMDSSKLILRLQSPSLLQIIQQANTESINLYCEAILKMIGHHGRAKGSRWEGIQYIKEVLQKDGLNPDYYHIEDGSGLSARNQVPAEFLTSFLQVMMKKHGIETISKLLPLAGKEGTVKAVLTDSPASGKVRVKSGSMQGIYTLTGHVHSSKGKHLVFCCMINGSPAKETKENRRHLEIIITAMHNFF